MLAKVVDLLEEFLDIVSNNVLDGLPLAWKISHQMDLIPRASFSNKAMHRMTPTESEVLNKLMNELL